MSQFAFHMVVPDHLEGLVKTGEVLVHGGELRDVAGRIRGFMEIVSPAGQVGLPGRLPNLGGLADLVTPANPLGMLASGTQIVQNQHMIRQLKVLQGMVGTVQALSCANLVLTTTNIGVSVVGFYIVCKKLEALSGSIQTIGQKVDSLVDNATRNLIQATVTLIRKSGNHVHALDRKEDFRSHRLSTMNLLSELETNFESALGRHFAAGSIALPLELLVANYCAYLNLAKALLTAGFLAGDSVDPEPMLNRARTFKTELVSPKMLGTIYNSHRVQDGRLLTEPELEAVVDIFELACEEGFRRLASHPEILASLSPTGFRDLQGELRALDHSGLVLVVPAMLPASEVSPSGG